MLSSLFIGLGIGASVLISQFYGAKDTKQVARTVNTIYAAFVIGAIPLSVVGILITSPVLHLLNVPEDAFQLAYIYVVIVFGGLIGSLGYNINTGILQGLGDSTSPLLFLAVACVVNIALDLIFVIAFGWGVAGVAIATVIAQTLSWIFGIVYINHKYSEIHISPFKFSMDTKILWKVMRIGIPTGIQMALFSVGMMVMQALVNSYGSDFMAGFNAANKLDTFTFMPIQSFATAATTYVGQNMGAHRLDRVRKGTISALIMSGGFSILSACILIPLGPLLMRMFSQNQAVIDAGMAYLYRIVPFFALLSIMFILNSIMRGAGETMVPLVGVVISLWLVRVPAAYFMDYYFGRDNMFFCYAIGWVPGLLITGIYFLTGRWKRHVFVDRQVPENEAQQTRERQPQKDNMDAENNSAEQ